MLQSWFVGYVQESQKVKLQFMLAAKSKRSSETGTFVL